MEPPRRWALPANESRAAQRTGWVWFDLLPGDFFTPLRGRMDFDLLDLAELFALADAIPDRRSEAEKAAIAKELSEARAELAEAIKRIEG
jgi:hypothetical protein